MKEIIAIDKPDYLTRFHIEKFDGGWKVYKTFNNKVTEVRYCLNNEHAMRTMTWMLNKFWNFRMN